MKNWSLQANSMDFSSPQVFWTLSTAQITLGSSRVPAKFYSNPKPGGINAQQSKWSKHKQICV